MNLDEFYGSVVNQSVLYNVTSSREIYRGQCVQPVMVYMANVLHLAPPYYLTAADYWEKGIPGLNRVVSDRNDPNQVPPRGAIVCFSRSLPGSGNAGHIDICWQATPGSASWVGLDSNWGGLTTHLVTHNWSYVVGWFISPEAPAAPAPTPQGGDEMIANENQARQAYGLLRPNGQPNQDEINQTAGRRTWQQFANDAQNEVSVRDGNLAAQAQLLANMQVTINQLNQTITDLRTNQTADATQRAEEQHAAQEKISYLTGQLEAHHDKLSQLQTANIPAEAAAQPAKPNLLTTLVLVGLKLWPFSKK